MKNVSCRICGSTRHGSDAEFRCECGTDEITIPMAGVTELINSRSEAEVKCASCGHEIFGLNVDAYLHSGGWKIPGLKSLWWLSIACPECDYETSFSKLGITR